MKQIIKKRMGTWFYPLSEADLNESLELIMNMYRLYVVNDLMH